MKQETIFFISCFLVVFMMAGCTGRPGKSFVSESYPPIFPDYTGVTVPASIAPLNFTCREPSERLHVLFEGEESGWLEVRGKKRIRIPEKQWRKLLEENKGKTIQVTVSARQEGKWSTFAPFPVYISEYPIDFGLVYRLVAPGYEVYSHMGIYQRSLSDFKQTTLIENTLIPSSCVNCHCFRQTDPGQISLHVRGPSGGTVLKSGGITEVLNLKTTEDAGRGVYPYWHPSGRYIAYSTNDTRQVFHAVSDKRIEVFDLSSDIILYDVEDNRIIASPLLTTPDFETFPAFSPDGLSLYFCLADRQEMPDDLEQARYNLCRIGFDPQTGSFGTKVDTLVHAADGGKSVSFPRPSYDGKYLMYTLSDYGTFSIWHKEADLWLLDLERGESRPLVEVNSDDTESYHSWSSNSRWFVFSSRRDDGLYTRLYVASIDEQGNIGKPFRLPEENPSVRDPSFYSFNIPEFVSAPVQLDLRQIEEKISKKEMKELN